MLVAACSMPVGCATVGEPTARSQALSELGSIHKLQAEHYYGRFTPLATAHVESYDIRTELTTSGYRIVAMPGSRNYPTYISDETLRIQRAE